MMSKMGLLGGRLGRMLSFTIQMVRYNLGIIFGGRFIWFALAAFVFYFLLALSLVFNQPGFRSAEVYDILVFPGMLLIFYPTVFGIQGDADARILEILFGIPNYRYKIWLVRLVIIFLLTWFFLALFCGIGYFALIPFNVFEMAGELMFPVLFLGCLAFLVSTVVKNGNGSAVVMVIVAFILLTLTDFLSKTQWNVFLNPYQIPQDMNEVVWAQIASKNRLFLVIGSLVFVLAGLTNLQRREKFLK